VRSLGLCGSVVELACGTGWWTRRLAAIATDLTCVDASPEVLELNRRRLAEAGLARPTYIIQADLFDWEPPGVFDAAFFSFWISHAPLDRFDAFWTSVASLLKPGGRAVFIDNAHRDESAAPHDRETQGRRDELQERRLNDGRVFQVVKLCHEPDALTLRLDKLGWTAEAKVTPTYFLFGHATRDR
jgi:SAM-dependent methyltransferase